MQLPARRWWIVGAVLAVAALAAALLTAVLVRLGDGAGVRRSIPAGREVTLAAEVYTPDGAGPHALIVMPASWGADATEYTAVAAKLVARGYVVVAYSQRGFRDSTGEVDFAGPDTQRDASTVIDWALAHTAADPDRIGMAGVSYGAGISLLAAERDPRVKAVAALSAWTDLDASLVQNGTLSTGTLRGLLHQIETKGRSSAFDRELQRRLDADPAAAADLLTAGAAVRSPITRVADLNAHGTAVLIANGWADSFFPPAQLVDFFDALTGPKRLELAVGDHTAPELAGLFGRPDRTIDDTLAWFDHYLHGTANGVDDAAPLQLQNVATRQWQGYPSWPGTTATADLGAPGSPDSAALTSPATWSTTLTTGTDTAATSGPAQIVAPSDYRPPAADLRVLGANTHALAWSAPALTGATTVTGAPAVHVSLAASAPSATVFTYLYDVAPSGSGQLMTMAPFTATGLTAGSAQPVAIRLQPTRWTLPAGHHLALVVDTVDLRFAQAAPGGSTLTISSSPAAAAELGIPTSG